MSVISTWEAVPGRLRIIFAYLAEKGPLGESEERLGRLTAPAGLGRSEESMLFPNSLKEAKALGLVAEQAGRLILVECPSKRELEQQGTVALFRERIEQLLLGEEASANPERGALARALAWLLMQSPYEPLDFGENQKTRIQNQLGIDGSIYDLGTNSSFQNLVYWGRYLGYCNLIGLKKTAVMADSSKTVIPDPTRAIESLMGRVLPSNSRITIQSFFSGLAQWTPLLEGGSVRAEVEARIRAGRGIHELSPATSLALVRLEQTQVLKLENLSDAEVYVMHSGHETRRITHLSRG